MIGGAYKKVKRLGAGGFGEVWEVKGPKGSVAMKQMRFDGLEEANLCLRESSVMLKLKHENVVSCDETFLHREGQDLFVCLTMPLFRGGDLMPMVKAAPVSSRKIDTVLCDISSALTYVHGQGYIHRDIKPQNIFISNTGRYYLADFGLCKDIGAFTRSIAGTPYYMAPEQFCGERYDSSVDLWALGVVLYVLMVPQKNMPDKRPLHLQARQTSDLSFTSMVKRVTKSNIAVSLLQPTASKRVTAASVSNLLKTMGESAPQTRSETKDVVKPVPKPHRHVDPLPPQPSLGGVMCTPAPGPPPTLAPRRSSIPVHHSPPASPYSSPSSSPRAPPPISVGDVVEVTGLSIKEMNNERGVVMKTGGSTAVVALSSGDKTIPLKYLRVRQNSPPAPAAPDMVVHINSDPSAAARMDPKTLQQTCKKILGTVMNTASGKSNEAAAVAAMSAACHIGQVPGGVEGLVGSGLLTPLLLILRKRTPDVLLSHVLQLIVVLYKTGTPYAMKDQRHVQARDVHPVVKTCMTVEAVVAHGVTALNTFLNSVTAGWYEQEEVWGDVVECLKMHNTAAVGVACCELLTRLADLAENITNTQKEQAVATLEVFLQAAGGVACPRTLQAAVLSLQRVFRTAHIPKLVEDYVVAASSVEATVGAAVELSSIYNIKLNHEVLRDAMVRMEADGDLAGLLSGLACLKGSGPVSIATVMSGVEKKLVDNIPKDMGAALGRCCMLCGVRSCAIPVVSAYLIQISSKGVLDEGVEVLQGLCMELDTCDERKKNEIWKGGVSEKLLCKISTSDACGRKTRHLALRCLLLLSDSQEFCSKAKKPPQADAALQNISAPCQDLATTSASLLLVMDSPTILLPHPRISHISAAAHRFPSSKPLKELRRRFSCLVCGQITCNMATRDKGFKCQGCVGKPSKKK